MSNNDSKTITMSYNEYLELSKICDKQIEPLFGMDYDSIKYMIENHERLLERDRNVCRKQENLKIRLDEMTLWRDQSFNEVLKLRRSITEYNSLPWYKRIFKTIVL